jgi:NAD+--asparagine ADP-ribosyltransferase
MTKLRDTRDDYRLGHLTADDHMDGVRISNKPHLRQTNEPYRVGSLVDKKMEEAEDVGSISDQNDEQVRNAAMEEFAKKIHQAVTAKVMGKKINLKLTGNESIVKQVTHLINMEALYLNALIGGQSSDTPALQKNKAEIEKEAKKLDRMLQTDNFWPFK